METDYNLYQGQLHLGQNQLILKMVTKFNCDKAHAVRNPLVFGQDLAPDDSHDILEDKNPYRELVGSLFMFLTQLGQTSVLSQYLDSPCAVHWRAAKRVSCRRVVQHD